jgi:hypothetical protein
VLRFFYVWETWFFSRGGFTGLMQYFTWEPERFGFEFSVVMAAGFLAFGIYLVRAFPVRRRVIATQQLGGVECFRMERKDLRSLRQLLGLYDCVVASTLDEVVFRSLPVVMLSMGLGPAVITGTALNVLFVMEHPLQESTPGGRCMEWMILFMGGYVFLAVALVFGSLILPVLCHGFANACLNELLPWQSWNPKEHRLQMKRSFWGVLQIEVFPAEWR